MMFSGKWKRTSEKLNVIKPPSFDRVAGYSSIIGLILSIVSIFGTQMKEFLENGFLHDALKLLQKLWIPFLWIWGIVLFICLIIMILKYRTSVIIKMNASSLGLSYVMDKTTEVIDRMENVEDEVVLVQKDECSNCETGKALYRILLNTMFV